MVKMKNRDVKILGSILKKIGKTDDPIACWNMSSRVIQVEGKLLPIEDAEKEPEKIKKYSAERYSLLEKYRTKSKSMQDPFGSVMSVFDVKNSESEAILASEMKKLDEKYKEEIELEKDRILKLRELMDIEVEVDIEPVNFKWCVGSNGKSLIGVDEIVFLRKFDLIVNDSDE